MTKVADGVVSLGGIQHGINAYLVEGVLIDVRTDREGRELTQDGLPATVDVTRQTINSTERGRYDPSLELAFDLAAFFSQA